MRVREAQIQTLAHAILSALMAQGFIQPKAGPLQLQGKIAEILLESFRTEAEIEAEAERLADAYARKMSGLDQRKIIQGIMERLAKERGFAL